jgi:hypothetical protein
VPVVSGENVVGMSRPLLNQLLSSFDLQYYMLFIPYAALIGETQKLNLILYIFKLISFQGLISLRLGRKEKYVEKGSFCGILILKSFSQGRSPTVKNFIGMLKTTRGLLTTHNERTLNAYSRIRL